MTRAPVAAHLCLHCELAIVRCERGTSCGYKGWRHAGSRGHCCSGAAAIAAEPGAAAAPEDPPAAASRRGG